MVSLKGWIGLLWAFIFFCQSQSLEGAKRKVLLIGIDGVRSDVLQSMHLSAFEFLTNYGYGTYTSWHQDITWSAPSWMSILTGVYHTKHRIEDNSFVELDGMHAPQINTIAKENNPNLKFGMYTEWESLYNNAKKNDWDDLILGEMGNTSQTSLNANNWIQQTDLDFYFVYFGEVDYWGHRLGFSALNPFYTSALHHVNDGVEKLMNAIKNRTNYMDEDWLILFTTDHGGKGFKHGNYSKEERQVFWFAYSDRILPKRIVSKDEGNINMSQNTCFSKEKMTCPVQTDIAVTALHHLLYDPNCASDWCIDDSWDGRSWLKDMGLQSDKGNITLLAKVDGR